MNLDDIPAGSLCVIDTNILIYAEQGASLQAQRLLRRIERQDVLGVLPQPVWQELTHKLMLAEAFMLGQITGGNPRETVVFETGCGQAPIAVPRQD